MTEMTTKTIAPLSNFFRSAPSRAVTGDRAPESVARQQEEHERGPQELSRSLTDAVTQVADHVQSVRRNLNFRVDEVSGQMVVKVIEEDSQEVIRQIPAEEILALARRLKELTSDQMSGLLVQSKA